MAAKLVRCAQIARNHVVLAFTAKRRKQLALVSQLLAQRARLGVGLLDLGRAPALGGHHGRPHGVLQMDLLPQASLGIRQSCDQFEPLAEVGHRLAVR